MKFRQLTSQDDWTQAWKVLKELKTSLTLDQLLAAKDRVTEEGYLLFGLEYEGPIGSVGGGIIYPHLTHGRDFWLHDLVTLKELRSKGLGKLILQHIKEYATANGCYRMCLHTRFEREDAIRFYEQKAEFEKYAVVFQKILAEI